MKTVEWKGDHLLLLDQTKLPSHTIYIKITDEYALYDAIQKMQVRGAPAIGIAAAFGLYLGVRGSETDDPLKFYDEILDRSSYLATARPTGMNLRWALRRLEKRAKKEIAGGAGVREVKDALLQEALMILKEDEQICRKIGEYGLTLLKDGMGILTHCNPGKFATAGYGTATAPLYLAKEKGWKKLKVYVDETRPLLQGSRLTAYELQKEGIDITLICDNMAASLMAQGKIDAVMVGANRIAVNGDVANKIGTYNLAVLCHYHQIPFYVAAPLSSIDLNTGTGKEIPIEERSGMEITRLGGRYIAPVKVKTYNPAFDITPAHLVSAIITEEGIIRPKKDGTYNLRGLAAFGI